MSESVHTVGACCIPTYLTSREPHEIVGHIIQRIFMLLRGRNITELRPLPVLIPYIHTVQHSGYLYRSSYSRTASSQDDQESARLAMKSDWFNLALQPALIQTWECCGWLQPRAYIGIGPGAEVRDSPSFQYLGSSTKMRRKGGGVTMAGEGGECFKVWKFVLLQGVCLPSGHSMYACCGHGFLRPESCMYCPYSTRPPSTEKVVIDRGCFCC